ncbi:MAG: membrane protein [Caldimonas sp.]|nr:MAG: membrane protein [Caldimonas sp.]
MMWIGCLFGVVAAWLLAETLGSDLGLAALGGLTGMLLAQLHRRVRTLEQQLQQPQPAPAAGAVPAMAKPPRPSETPPAPHPAPSVPRALAAPAAAAEARVKDGVKDGAAQVPPASSPAPAAQAPAARTLPAASDERSVAVTTSLGQTALAWLRGGNTIVRVGVLILFFGVAFLLRYAAEHALLPIELRLAAVALGGLGLSVIGWRLRERRRGYGQSLQGAGIGVLYLTIFAAFRLYGVVPAGLAFALLLALSATGAVMAVVQRALPLAVLGFAGGFLAPVVASTGQGSHVALFSYYLVLNLAIAWIASRQAWKLLNLVGFVFTFSIASLWGWRSWRPEHFATTEPFLIAHFALYLYICVQYSRQLLREDAPRGLPVVDGGLLFGLPLVAFGLQAGLVSHWPYGLAVSAAVLSGVYLVLGRWLWQRSGGRLLLLIEGLFALGVVFLLLVTPLALGGSWTSAAWAVQGAGIVWLGLRQRRWWATGLGLLLQLVAAAWFWDFSVRPYEAPVFANAFWLSTLMLGGSALVSAWLLHRHAPAPASDETALPVWNRTPPAGLWQAVHWGLLALGLLQCLTGLWSEVQEAYWAWPNPDTQLVLLWLATAVGLELAHRRLAWPALRLPARLLWAGASLVAMGGVAGWIFNAWYPWEHVIHQGGWLATAGVLAVGVWLLRRLHDAHGLGRATFAERLWLAWFAMLQGAILLHALASMQIGPHLAWTAVAPIVGPTVLAWVLWNRTGPAALWLRGLHAPWLLLLVLWSAWVNLTHAADMAPLPNLPLLNPVDLGHALGLLYAWRLWRGAGPLPPWWQRPVVGVTAAVVFAWINTMLVRSLHHWSDTPMWLDGALYSDIVQMALTILWTLMALTAMLWATRKAGPAVARPLWLAGAGLLAVVVLKLFFVDLASLDTLRRIVTFLGVGLLMLVIGYVSPLPPAASVREVRQ